MAKPACNALGAKASNPVNPEITRSAKADYKLPPNACKEKKIGKRKGVELWLSGTADWEDESGEIWDWKNPSRFYEPWEKRRWDIQSHAYCWALGAEKFNLAVFANGQYQHIPIERNEADHKAFIDLCWSIVPLITADIKPWPMNWTGWHCSPKWCPVWQDGKCRGKHLGQGKPESW